MSLRLPDDISVTAAELAGIDLALDAIRVEAAGRHVILLCDSKSALHLIAGTGEPVLRGYFLQKILSLMTGTEKQIRLVWTPGHVGIDLNEAADQAAKQAVHFAFSEVNL